MAYLQDVNGLAKKLIELSALSFDAVLTKTLTQMFNRAKAEPYTPIKTGELMKSRRVDPAKDFQGSFGYVEEYAPHVEFGHRTLGGGYVEGQYFLKKHWDLQKKIYEEDLREQVRKALK